MKAKKNELLSQLASAMSGRLPSVDVNVLGTKYTLKLAASEADDWIAAQTSGMTLSAVSLNVKKPTVAVALAAINDIPVEQLFQLGDDIDANVKEQLNKDALAMRDWRRAAIMDWLKEIDSYVVNNLYTAIMKMLDTHRESLTEAQNLSLRTP